MMEAIYKCLLCSPRIHQAGWSSACSRIDVVGGRAHKPSEKLALLWMEVLERKKEAKFDFRFLLGGW
jgi:hypothetical protein